MPARAPASCVRVPPGTWGRSLGTSFPAWLDIGRRRAGNHGRRSAWTVPVSPGSYGRRGGAATRGPRGRDDGGPDRPLGPEPARIGHASTRDADAAAQRSLSACNLDTPVAGSYNAPIPSVQRRPRAGFAA